MPLPVGHHAFLLLLGKEVKHKRLVEVEDEEDPDDSNPVLVLQDGNLPEGVAEWILEESSDVLECSPSLGHISWLLCSHYELSKVTIGLLSEGSIQQNN